MSRFREAPMPARMKPHTPPGSRLYMFRAEDTGAKHGKDDGGVIVSRDDGRLHLSISLPHRLPTWEEITEARKQLLPADVFFCVPFPPEKYWMSVHPYTMHLFEIRDETLISLWTEIGEAVGGWTMSRQDDATRYRKYGGTRWHELGKPPTLEDLVRSYSLEQAYNAYRHQRRITREMYEEFRRIWWESTPRYAETNI